MDVIIGALYAGVITGGCAVICGAIKGKLGLGLGGFFCCLVSAILLGFILAIPVCAIFLWQIFKKEPKNNYENSAPPPTQTGYVRFCGNCGYPIPPHSHFCSKCGVPLGQAPTNESHN